MPQQPLYRVNPDRTAPWNNLPALPIQEELYRTVRVYEQLGRAKEALALLAGRLAAIPNSDLLINSITLQEAKDSCAIENIFTSADDLYQVFSERPYDEALPDPAGEVLRYRKALWEGYRYLQQHETFNVDYFNTLHRGVKESGDGIRPPFAKTDIRQGGNGSNAGQCLYTPPRGKGIVEAKLENLIEFLNDLSMPPNEPLLKMTIAHFQFEAIHPFRDGNGRVGRILNIHYLAWAGLLELPILCLSRYIIENREQYYETLAGVSQRGDWEAWMLYMLRAVEATARFTYMQINDIMDARESLLQVVKRETGFRRPEQLIEAVFMQPYSKVNHLTDRGLYAENTARNYLNELASMGVLQKKEKKGKHYYLNLELMRILEY